MKWTAIVPLKQGAHVKSRLADILSESQRERLAAWMADEVLSALDSAESIGRILIVSEVRMSSGKYDWFPATGVHLNDDLDRARSSLVEGPYLIVHGDLPMLMADEIDELTAEAEISGFAIAPDQAGTGTNALAVRDDLSFPLHFGQNSFSRHVASAPSAMRCVARPGLALDIDTPKDLQKALMMVKGEVISSLLRR